jgi:hypothetical protein
VVWRRRIPEQETNKNNQKKRKEIPAMKTNIYLRLAALLLTAGLVGPALAGEKVPFHGSLEGSFTSTINPGPPPVATIFGSGTGQATHLGRFTYEFPHTINFGIVPTAAIGTWTFVAANGDTLIGDAVAHSSPVEPGVLLAVNEVVITGGTGRFAGASGELVIVSLVFQSTGTTLGSFEGTISSPGAAKRL